MKIICGSQEEYDKLMETSKYLHDFDFNIPTCKRSLWRKHKKQGLYINQEVGLVGFLCHLYLGEEDFPNKKDVIIIETEKETINDN